MKTILLIMALTVACRFSGAAAPLTESTFTEIINEVNILSAAGDATAAKTGGVLEAPQRVRTGPQSRAELTAPDKTITRVGANTVFSYADSGRTLNLEQGNLLFHAPKGLGGGIIKSGGAAAAVLGTTLTVSATTGGGFKVILLEGKGQVTLPNGNSVTLKAGQEVFVLPGGTEFSKVFNINLDRLVKGSLLVNGFSHELSSLPLILAAMQDQDSQLKSGAASDTGQPPEFFLPPPAPGNGQDVLDPATCQTAAHPPLNGRQLGSLGVGQISTGKPPSGIGPGGRPIVVVTGIRTINPP
jgi:hypothetical protein